MEKSSRLAGTARARFGTGILIAAAATVLLRTLSLFLFYDIGSGYFLRASVLPVIACVAVSVAAVACVVFCYVPKLSVLPEVLPESNAFGFLFLLPAAASVYFIYRFERRLSEYALYGESASRLEILGLVLAIAALIYFLIQIAPIKLRVNVAPIFAVLAALWLITIISEAYFDMLVPMNSPNKTFNAFALVSSMLFLVSEMRLTISEKNNAFRLFSVSFAVLMNSVSSIPSLIAHFGGAFGGSYSFGMGETVCLALLFPAVARLAFICYGKELSTDEEAPTTTVTTD